MSTRTHHDKVHIVYLNILNESLMRSPLNGGNLNWNSILSNANGNVL